MKTYKRNEEQLHIAPTWILALNMICWVVVFILLIVGAIMTFSNGFISGIKTLALPFIIIFIYGIFSEIYFTYEERLNIKIVNNDVCVEYTLNKDMLPTGNSKVSIDIKNITKIKGTKVLTVYGDIVKKAPMGKVTKLKKYKIKAFQFNDVSSLIEDLNRTVQKQ